MIHRSPGRQLVGEAGKLGRRLPRSRRVGDIVAEEAEREHPAPVRSLDAAGAVQRQHVEEDGVAGLERPADDLVGGAVRLDVRQIVEGAFGEPPCLVVHEGPRHQPRATVRAGHELERRAPVKRGRPATTPSRSARRRRCSTADPGATACAGSSPAPSRARGRGRTAPVRRPSARRRSPLRETSARRSRAPAAAASCRSPRRSGPGRPACSRRGRAGSDPRGSGRSPPLRGRSPRRRTLPGCTRRRLAGTPRRARRRQRPTAAPSGESTSLARVEP